MTDQSTRPAGMAVQQAPAMIRPRRGSLTSISSKAPPLDREAMTQFLDEVHGTASKLDTLTCFHDFDGSNTTRLPGPKELVTGGIAGLYSRIKQTVSGSPETARPTSSGSATKADTASVRSGKSTIAQPSRSRPDADPQPSPLVSKIAHDNSVQSPSPASPKLDSQRSRRVSTDLHSVSPRPTRMSLATTNEDAVRSSARTSSRVGRSIAPASSSSRSRIDESSGNLQRVVSAQGRASHSRGRSAATSKDTASIHEESAPFAGPELTDVPNKRASIQSRKSIGSPEARADPSTREDRLSDGGKGTSRDSSRLRQNGSGAPAPSALLKPLTRLSEKRPPTVTLSRTSSTADTNDIKRPLSNISSAATTPRAEHPPNLNIGFRRPSIKVNDDQKLYAVVPAHLKRRVVSKEFWMKDENARDCFFCGEPFSTFRRKHHCRTCGQIFCAKCTTLVSGRPFDLPGTLRLCHPCEDTIYGSGDDSTVFSDDDDDWRMSLMYDDKAPSTSREVSVSDPAETQPAAPTLSTPSIGIPASRRNREAKRRSAIIEFDANPLLARPGSSRSLKSLAGRPRSSSHRRHPSKHQYAKSMRQLIEERGPFHQGASSADGRPLLPAFHNDNIIDPDLAAFMSDEGSDDDRSSIFTVMHAGSQPSSFVDHDQAGFASMLHSSQRKVRSRPQSTRDDGSRLQNRNASKLRKRNPSIASISFARPSPRRSRSQNFFLSEGIDGPIRGDGSDVGSAQEIALRGNLEGKIKRSAAMHGNNAPKIELNSASLQHVRRLLAQLLQDHHIPHAASWEKALVPILLQCTDDVDPDVQHGDDMDIRNYIKLKKVPGGKPGDTAYVSGVVFSRNIALKGMKRSFSRPRIVIVTFAIEYARHNTHFMSLEPILAQEREYLRNLVGRIAALRPHVLLVQRNVSGLALEMLQAAGITVITRVKESVLAAVARVTKTIMIKSIDKLSMDPGHLGACENFDVKTYLHNGSKKTYIFISGCQPSLGCTIVLRGSATESLRKVKRITEFMCYVVYNLKLETCLMRDEFVSIPSSNEEHTAPAETDKISKRASMHARGLSADTLGIEQDAISLTGADTDMADLVDEDSASPSYYRKMVQASQTKLMSSSPFVKFTEPHLLKRALEQECAVTRHQKLLHEFSQQQAADGEPEKQSDERVSFQMLKPEMLLSIKPKELSRPMRTFLQDISSVQYQRSVIEFRSKRKQWDSFFETSNQNPFDPFLHQNIFVLHSLVSSVTSAPCAGPEVIGLSFYADYEQEEMNYQDDCTLGQFVEDICMGAATSCKTCGRKMFDHHRQYVHGDGQLTVSVARQASKIKGLQNCILMWSSCKICNAETTVMPMSDNTWKYSLGKYLEISFWSTPLKPRAGLCHHDVHKDFVRCFGFQDQVVRVQHDKIDVYEVVVPTPTINWAIHSDIALKNKLYTECIDKLSTFTSSIKARLASINLSTVETDKTDDASVTLEKLSQKLEHDHRELLDKIQTKYMTSRYYEFLPLNRAIRAMDEKALAWDEAFGDFERNFFPSETAIRNLATLQLKKLFLDRSDSISGDGEGVELKDASQLRLGSVAEMLHSEKAQDVLTSVLEESISHDRTDSLPSSGLPKPHLGSPTDSRLPNMTHSEVEKAVDREDVKHLDLAVASATADQLSPVAQTLSMDTADSLRTGLTEIAVEEAIPEPEPLNQTLVEKIEQIRAAATAGHADEDSTETKLPDSRIPRFADLQRKGSLHPPVPLIRAQSSPNQVLYRSAEKGAAGVQNDLVEAENESDEETGESPQASSSRPPENRLIDRITAPRPLNTRAVSMIPRSVPSKTFADNATRVSALAKHFEQLSREFEKERLRERRMRAAQMRQNRAGHLPSSQPVVEVFRDASEAVSSMPEDARADSQKRPHTRRTTSGRSERSQARDHSVDDLTHDPADTTDADQTDNERHSYVFSHGTSDTEMEGETDGEIPAEGRRDKMDRFLDPSAGNPPPPLLSPSAIPDLELPLPKHEKSSLMKVLSSFWSERSASGWAPLEYPLTQTEHVFDDSDIVVREDEPSSVIALALSSNDYLKKVSEFRANGRARSRHINGSTFDSEAIEQAAIETSLVSETGTHMKYSFGHNQVRAQCKIFYAESFDALRRKCGVSDRFVESLSRSIKWDSKGGKTKSLFLKTLDDRFVIKSLQEVELKAFTRFAPDYFAFMSQTLFHGVPSVIAKMFGLFQVMIKNPATGVEFSSYLLVMENLFYDHKPTRRFDLKGSMRNRKIESTGQPDEVLLDENLVETIFETPLFVREHARKLVKASVWNDTMWLCRQNVMDYSLMAGFDDPSRRLFVGIIDCIRTYTWDKKLESWIKDRGKNKPTITSPKDYRNRFRVSMMQYVLQSPNVYHEFSRSVGVGTALPEREREVARETMVGGEGGEVDEIEREMGSLGV